jgi:catechol 2,3-dioxygenase-like lactoylglutathione lyase family enzyme
MYKGIDHIALAVNDIERAVDRYQWQASGS